MEINLTTVLVAALGAGGIGAFAKDLLSGLAKIRGGVAVSETRRKADLASQLSAALIREAEQRARADRADRNRQRVQETNGRLRYTLVVNGIPLEEQPPEPDLEEAVTEAQLERARGEARSS